MKSILLIVASLFAFNENINYYDRTNLIFSKINATYVPQATTYFYTYRHNPAQMDPTAYSNFRNGSSKLIYEIPSTLNVDISRSSEFYIQVDTTKYYFETELGYITDRYYIIDNFFDFNYTATTNIYISIPSLDGSAISNYQNELDTKNLYTREAFKQQLLSNEYFDGYDDGYDLGYLHGDQDGQILGYDIGYDDGYDQGFIQGATETNELTGVFALLAYGFVSLSSILSIQLFPGFTLGLLLFLPLIFGIAYVLIKLLLGNG